MKKIAFLLIMLFCGVAIHAAKPLTQYCLIQASDGQSAALRAPHDMARLLRIVGFNVSTYEHPSYMDEMDDFTVLKATRKNGKGTTRLTMSDGEDNVCVIDFATKAEVAAFVDSMRKSGYTQEGTLYSHPLNSNGQPPYVHVRVKGLRVKIITPFEMLPYDF